MPALHPLIAFSPRPAHPRSTILCPQDLALCCVFAADYCNRIRRARPAPLLAALQPLNIIDLLSFAPSLLGLLAPGAVAGLTAAGLDLRWFRVFRYGGPELQPSVQP